MESGKRVALLAIAINAGLCMLKYMAAELSGSIALRAEAFHTFADFMGSIIVFWGLKFATGKTKKFPYGLYKIENLVAVCLGLMILYSGYEIVLEILSAEGIPLRNSGIAILSLVVSSLITLLFSRYERKIGKQIQSPILLADAEHVHTDVLSNLVVLFGVFSSLAGYPLDKIAALIVVGFIANTGIEILKDGARVLLDASLDYPTLNKVEKIILDTPAVVGLRSLTGRNSGRFKFIEVNLIIKAHELEQAHFIVDEIEKKVKASVLNIDQIWIHYEPEPKKKTIYALPLLENQTVVSEHFGEAAYFMLVTFCIGQTRASTIEIIENPHKAKEKSKGILTAEFLTEKMVDIVLVQKNFQQRGPGYVFSDAHIQVVLTEKKDPAAVFSALGLDIDRTG